MLVLRLMGACNNQCFFCMVRNEMRRSGHPTYEEIRQKLSSLEPGSSVDFFGGEPTLYPHFWDALELAVSLGLHVGVATNARVFHDRRLAERIAGYGVSIRSSLYGHDADLHDHFTGVRGSFAQTITGIQNLADAGCQPQINVVMLNENCTHLAEITSLLGQCGVRRIKYSTVIQGSHISDSIPSIETVRISLNKAIEVGLGCGMGFLIEKSPLCLVPMWITQHLPESDPAMIPGVRQIFSKPNICSKCRLDTACLGLDRAYLARHEDHGLKPFAEWPTHAVQTLSPADFDSYIPPFPTNLIVLQITGVKVGEYIIRKVAAFRHRLQSQYRGCYVLGWV
jgi:organic radical activating enzyme